MAIHARQFDPDDRGPLDGLRVLEHVAAGGREHADAAARGLRRRRL